MYLDDPKIIEEWHPRTDLPSDFKPPHYYVSLPTSREPSPLTDFSKVAFLGGGEGKPEHSVKALENLHPISFPLRHRFPPEYVPDWTRVCQQIGVISPPVYFAMRQFQARHQQITTGGKLPFCVILLFNCPTHRNDDIRFLYDRLYDNENMREFPPTIQYTVQAVHVLEKAVASLPNRKLCLLLANCDGRPRLLGSSSKPHIAQFHLQHLVNVVLPAFVPEATFGAVVAFGTYSKKALAKEHIAGVLGPANASAMVIYHCHPSKGTQFWIRWPEIVAIICALAARDTLFTSPTSKMDLTTHILRIYSTLVVATDRLQQGNRGSDVVVKPDVVAQINTMLKVSSMIVYDHFPLEYNFSDVEPWSQDMTNALNKALKGHTNTGLREDIKSILGYVTVVFSSPSPAPAEKVTVLVSIVCSFFQLSSHFENFLILTPATHRQGHVRCVFLCRA